MIANIARNAIDGGAQGSDPDFSKVSLLLHMDGANGSTTFVDSSRNALTVTASNVTISTSGTMSGFGQVGYFNGSTSYLRIGSNAAFNFGTGDFTIEAWIYPTVSTGYHIIVSRWNNGGTNAFGLYTNNSNINFDIGTSTGNSLGAFTANTWTHVAVSRSGTTVKGFVNGNQTMSITNSSSMTATSDILVGSNDNGARYYFTGNIDEVRISGVARYTANFTVPSGPFSNP